MWQKYKNPCFNRFKKKKKISFHSLDDSIVRLSLVFQANFEKKKDDGDGGGISLTEEIKIKIWKPEDPVKMIFCHECFLASGKNFIFFVKMLRKHARDVILENVSVIRKNNKTIVLSWMPLTRKIFDIS